MVKEGQILISITDYGRYMYKGESVTVTNNPADLLIGWLESDLLLQVSSVILVPHPSQLTFF